MPALHLVQNTPKTLSADDLLLQFCYNCGMKRLPWMRQEFAAWLAQGFEPELIEEAINRTARAPRPSFAYLEAILRNSERVGALDLATFLLTQRKQRQAPDELPY